MEDVKNRMTARELEALLALERRAVELEGERDPAPFEQAEAEYAQQLDAAQHEGDQELQGIVSGADQRFTAAFANGQGLLGPQWPLATLQPVPLPAAAQTA